MSNTVITQGFAGGTILIQGFGAGQLATKTQILLAAKERIEGLGLPACSAGTPCVVKRKVLATRNIGAGTLTPFPTIVLVPLREILPPTGGVIGLNDVTYVISCVMLIGDNQEKTLERDQDTVDLWRERITRAFHHKRLTGAPTVVNAFVEPGDPAIVEGWEANILASALLLRFVSRETRDN